MTRFNLTVRGRLIATEVGHDALAAMIVAVTAQHGGPVEVVPVRDALRQRGRLASAEVTAACWADQVS